MSRQLVEELFPQLEPRTVVTIEDGWDSLVLDVDGEWIVRAPRRPEVREWLEMEVRLLPEVAPTLPVPIPHFERVTAGAVAYRKLPGAPVDASRPELGAQTGRFLAGLHAFPVERARELGVPEPPWRETYRRLTREVLEAADVGPAAEAMVDDFLGEDANFAFTPTLIHGDLGPEHLLSAGDELTGVIDWGDARIGDPAYDFSWLLHGAPPPFADAVLAEYGPTERTFRDRALFFHRLVPWHELHYGLHFDRPEFVESGLAGIRSRLPGRLP